MTDNESASQQEAISISQFCKMFSVGQTTVFTEIREGRLKAVKVGRRTLIPIKAARAWLLDLPDAREDVEFCHGVK